MYEQTLKFYMHPAHFFFGAEQPRLGSIGLFWSRSAQLVKHRNQLHRQCAPIRH